MVEAGGLSGHIYQSAKKCSACSDHLAGMREGTSK